MLLALIEQAIRQCRRIRLIETFPPDISDSSPRNTYSLGDHESSPAQLEDATAEEWNENDSDEQDDDDVENYEEVDLQSLIGNLSFVGPYLRWSRNDPFHPGTSSTYTTPTSTTATSSDSFFGPYMRWSHNDMFHPDASPSPAPTPAPRQHQHQQRFNMQIPAQAANSSLDPAQMAQLQQAVRQQQLQQQQREMAQAQVQAQAQAQTYAQMRLQARHNLQLQQAQAQAQMAAAAAQGVNSAGGQSQGMSSRQTARCFTRRCSLSRRYPASRSTLKVARTA